MQYAAYQMNSGVMPPLCEFQKLGDYSSMRIERDDGYVFLTYSPGTTIKFCRTKDASLVGFERHVYLAANKNSGMKFFRTEAIVVKEIGTKLVAIDALGIETPRTLMVDQNDKTVQIVIRGAISGDPLCTVSAFVECTVSALTSLVKYELLRLGQISACTPVRFTDYEFALVQPNRKLKNLFMFKVEPAALTDPKEGEKDDETKNKDAKAKPSKTNKRVVKTVMKPKV